MLGVLGRPYTGRQAEAFVRRARRAGFPVVGDRPDGRRPDRDSGRPAEDDERRLGLEPDHVSLYLMECLEGLPFEAFAREHPVEEDESADAYEFMREGLEASGLRRYEISNFAREGAECRA